MRARRIAAALVAAGTAGSLLIAPGVAAAHPRMTTVATGLDNPRGLAFGQDGALYVAEAGVGGAGPCFPGPEGGEVCFGTSGAITRIGHGRPYEVVRGLPSIAEAGGHNAIGPSDVSSRGELYFTVGLGADPALRAQLPAVGQQAAGWLLRDKKHGWRQVADIAGFEASANPDGGLPDSNPQSLLDSRGDLIVADAGGNSLVRVSSRGKVSTIATFPDQLVDAPPFLGGASPRTKIPSQAVPTSVVRGPDGAYYVGTLTGFPFAVGSARVFRVVPGKAPKVYAEGFTNIMDLAFGDDGRLYVLEHAVNGILAGDGVGALIRVGRGGSQHVVAEFVSPGGLTIRGGSAYVSNCGTCPGDGTVVKVRL